MYSIDITKSVICLQFYSFIVSCEFDNVFEDKNMIIDTETTFRNISSMLFSVLNFSRTDPILRQALLVHSYFTNITVLNHQTLNVITTLSRVEDRVNTSNINIDNILNEENETKAITAKRSQDVLEGFDKYLDMSEYNGSVNFDDFANIDVENDVKNILISDSFEKHFLQSNENIIRNQRFDKLTNENEYWAPSPARRIYKGQKIQPMQFPYIASIHIYEDFKCAGSIIWSDLIVTAASCLQVYENVYSYNLISIISDVWENNVFRKNPSFISVRIGSDHFDRGGEVIRASEVFFHSGYNPKNLTNNVAVIRLVRHILFDSQNIKKIVYDRKHGAVKSRFVTIAGWGSKGPRHVYTQNEPTLLAYDELNVYDMKECREIYTSEYVSKKNFCAGYVERGSGACNHDVGGPGVVDGALTGIISFGPKVCGTPDAPTVFTKLGYYSMWIDSIVDGSGAVTVSTTPDDGLTNWASETPYYYTVSHKPPMFSYDYNPYTTPPRTTWYVPQPPYPPTRYVPYPPFIPSHKPWFSYNTDKTYYTKRDHHTDPKHKKTFPWVKWLTTMSAWNWSPQKNRPPFINNAPVTIKIPGSDETYKPHHKSKKPYDTVMTYDPVRTEASPWLTWLDYNNKTWPTRAPKKPNDGWYGNKEESYYYSAKNEENKRITFNLEKIHIGPRLDGFTTGGPPKGKKVFKDISQILNKFVKYIW